MLINRLVLTFLLIFITSLVEAQKLYFSDTSNKWTFLCISDPTPPNYWFLSDNYYQGYQTLNGKIYSLLATGELVRDDTATARVMMYIDDTTEIVLYDWSLQIGDTLPYVIQPITFYSILNSVDTFYYNNVALVKQGFDVERSDGLGSLSYQAWEGLGCNWNLAYPSHPNAIEPTCFLCSFRNSDTLYFKSSSCILSVNDNNKNDFTIKVYPSPAHDELIIQSNIIDDKALISLQDITGKELLQKKGLKETNKVSLSNIPPGTYFIRIVSNNIRETYKVIVQ